ncbi:MAG: hypothetical protein ABIH82_05340 [Candidatus Woesearchaeota archaeon]
MKTMIQRKYVSLVLEGNTFHIEKKPGFENPQRDDRYKRQRDILKVFSEKIFDHTKGLYLDKLYSQVAIGEMDSSLCIAVTNAELHGNLFTPDKVTTVTYSVFGSPRNTLLEFTVTDQGEGFDHAHLRRAEMLARGTTQGYNCFRSLNNSESLGYGCFEIIRGSDYVYWNDKGNKITFGKQLRR